LDEEPVAPGAVVFNSRAQELSATLGGVLDSCSFNCTTDMDEFLEDGITPNPNYGVTTCSFTVDNCLWDDEEIELMLETTSANHFNFIAPDVGSGEHEIKVCVGLAAESSEDASAHAVVNVGSLSVEVVKSANTDTGITIDL
jgi:hypothetical protein